VVVEREMIPRNSARVGAKRRKLKPRRPDRTYFDRADQIESMLDAAGELDRTGRGPRVRRPLLASLIFAGLRLGEVSGSVGATSTWPRDDWKWSTPKRQKAAFSARIPGNRA
jgi:hypothetical protein